MHAERDIVLPILSVRLSVRLGHDHAQALSARRVSAQLDTAHLVSAQTTRRHAAAVRACSTASGRGIIRVF